MSLEPTCDLSIIIVSWNVRDLLRACLVSTRNSPSPSIILVGEQRNMAAEGRLPSTNLPIYQSTNLPPHQSTITAEVIVVDNASSDGSAAMVVAEFPWVRLVANPDNRGFTAGNNQGLALSQGRYVLFLNPDTEVIGDALITMLAYMKAHPAVGAVGPLLRYADGSLQSSRRRFPTFGTALFESTPLAWHWPDNPWARRYRIADRPDDEIQEVDWVVGAALLVRRQTLDQVGDFDEGYFMYSEELDLCRRIKAAGWQIVYLPTAQIIHHEGKSSEQVVAARHIRFQTSKVRYFRKFHGPLVAGALRFSILATFAVEWALEALKWLLGLQRPLRRARLAAYGQLLRSGLRSGVDK